MTSKESIFYVECKKLTRRRNLVIIFTLSALLLVMQQYNIYRYKESLTDIVGISETEQLCANQFKTWSTYATYGVILASYPSPMIFIEAFKIYGELYAHINTDIGLRIFETKKNRDVLPDPASGYLNFSGLLLLVVGILLLIYGYPAFQDEKQLKFLSSLRPSSNVFWKVLLSRMFFVSIIILLLILCSVIIAFLNGINVLNPYYLCFTLVTLLVSNFFLFAGTFLGTVKNKAIGITALVLVFSINYVSPWLFGVIASSFSPSISERQTEKDKLEILSAFENRGIKKFGKVRRGETVKEFITGFFDNELKLIENVEIKHKSRIFKMQKIYQSLSCLLPGSFFIETVLELSGQGFKNYSLFYEFVEQEKHKFTKYYADNEFFSEPKPPDVESYVKDNNNIFYAKPSLPDNFWIGIFLTLFYSAIFLFFAHRNFKNKIYRLKEKLEDEMDLYVEIDNKKTNILFTGSETFKTKLFNHFSGKEKLKGDIAILPDPEAKDSFNTNFAYIPNREHFKNISSNTLYCFMFGTKPAKALDFWDIMLQYMRSHPEKIFILDEYTKDMPPQRIKELKEWLEHDQIYCLLLTHDYYFTKDFVKKSIQLFIEKDDPTGKMLKTQFQTGPIKGEKSWKPKK